MRHFSLSHLLLIAKVGAFGAALVFTAGCPEGLGLIPVAPEPDPDPQPDPEPEPELDGGTVEQDGGFVDGGPADGGVGQPLRTVGERSLMGGLPLKNRFLDPRITQQSFGWQFFGESFQQQPQIVTVHLPGTPFGAPAAKIPKGQNPPGVTALGVAKSSSGALAISVWAARHEGVPDVGLQTLEASLLGVYEGQGAAVDLSLDEESAPVMADGLVWRRFTAEVAEGPIGWAYLSLTDDASSDLYFAAPTLVSVPSAGFAAGGPGVAGALRPLTEKDRRGVAILQERMRDQLRAPGLQGRPTSPDRPGAWVERASRLPGVSAPR